MKAAARLWIARARSGEDSLAVFVGLSNALPISVALWAGIYLLVRAWF